MRSKAGMLTNIYIEWENPYYFGNIHWLYKSSTTDALFGFRYDGWESNKFETTLKEVIRKTQDILLLVTFDLVL